MAFLMTTVEQASFTASTMLSKNLRVSWCKMQEMADEQKGRDIMFIKASSQKETLIEQN